MAYRTASFLMSFKVTHLLQAFSYTIFAMLCRACVICSRPKGQIPLRYPGRRLVRSWSQTCSELEFGLCTS